MAQQDAMEQVKEVVRQIIKYRFWISVGVAALFGLIAYAVGSGPVRDQFKKESDTIKAAENGVKQYRDASTPTKEYAPIVDEKTGVLTHDVNAAWRTLYNRQAPLLTWPDTVQERFRKWGRKWPEDEDSSRVILGQIDFIKAYPDYVDMVYKTFKPFDYQTGEGIVVAAPKEVLLRPAVFSDEKVPGLGKIWAAQERLWIQHTLLEVIAQVNKNAKDWDSAIVREILTMEVGTPVAQDQRSLAKNEELQDAPNILAPGETEETADVAAAPSGPMSGMMMNRMMGQRGGMMAGGGGAQDSQTISYVKGANDEQFKKLPVMITVLVDQDRVQDFLVELENSPMSIQVMDFELQRPSTAVTKPEKGAAQFGGYGGGMGGMDAGMGMMSQMMRMRGMTGYGGMMGSQGRMMMQGMGQMSGMMGRMGGMAPAAARKGTDVRNVNRADTRKKQEEQASKAKGPTFFDPYFDIVQVTVYGQARFFLPPPPVEPTEQPSPGETAAAPDAAATAAAAAPGPDGKTAASPSSSTAAADADAKASAPAAGDAAAKTDGGTDDATKKADGGADDATKKTAAPSGEAASKKDEGPAEAGKSAAPSAAPKTDSEGAPPKS